MQEDMPNSGNAVAEHTRLTHLSEHLANERTYLAYLRTAVSLMSFGIAVNRFSLYLEQSDRQRTTGERLGSRFISSEQLGIGMVFLGMALLVWAALHYEVVMRRIEAQNYRARPLSIIILSALVLLFGISSVVSLFVG